MISVGYLPSSNYTEYCIETETNKPYHFKCDSNDLNNVIQVWRRYSDFDLILTWLRKEFPALIIPSLPYKTYLKSYNINFVDDRKEKINLWLIEILNINEIKKSNLICALLG